MHQRKDAVQEYLYRLVHGEQGGLANKLLLGCLRVLSWFYGGIVWITLAMYRLGILQQHKLSCLVFCLGNITVGGTGKTPTAQRLAAVIRDMGYRVVILNRGYRSSWRDEVGLVSDGRNICMTVQEAGDEAYLLAKSLPGVPVVIGKNRSVTGAYAVKELKAQVIILDDGYQHWQLARDLDIVLIDTVNMFGNNCLLPRGTLREPLPNLDRGHVFLLTKVDQAKPGARDKVKETLARYNDHALVLESVHQPQYFIEIADWYKDASASHIPLDQLTNHKVFAFSAIGNPSSFEQTIRSVGLDLVAAKRFQDHHGYSMLDMQELMEKAGECGAQALITTEKDAVKVPPEFVHSHRSLPMYILGIEVQILGDETELPKLIRKVLNEEGC
ncbi:tetraacyldisaccharide 4'-kinase [Acetonema longum]|uniref:Tetraacyldisaccharide 4'-kinase n=1 Tax=Acetonema longum DSM 6540 TaxID=1009370 RepID=F7NM06_9FIRM|nr:tetraacyldisaccharide 4'-kinase [Acetonema longum]EGO62932.1 tetraacyldisaccharide 4'-kinase [Acetonema longum DSM 6540]